MTSFSAADLAAMQATQDGHMMDACRVLVYSASADDYGIPSPTYTPGNEIACGFDPARTREVQDEGEVVLSDARLRLPIGTSLESRDRIRITKRFGSAVAAVDYDVVGLPARGPSGLVVDVKQVTDGS